MKPLLCLFTFIVSSIVGAASAQAFEDGQWNLQTGIGIHGARGLLGISADRFFNANHALTLAAGLDFVGATSTVGYKYFSDKIPPREGAWGRCFFLFECDTYMYGSVALQYGNETKSEIREDGQVLRSYESASKVLGLVGFGGRSVFRNNITLDGEITYRNILSGGKSTQTSGLPADDKHLLEMGYHDFGAGFAIGYLF